MPHPKPNVLPHVEVLVLRKNLLFSILAQSDQPMFKGYRICMLTSTLTDTRMRLPYFDNITRYDKIPSISTLP
ncbi:hypothetical protein ALC62_14949 [Cyphomyrmex costatus]|uniref:Uncharacterized protein n=1 Tax=Cyphomyrmex costatus TaxID=456900 RepID=A0A195C2S0_9HYME|nr:hypothetical protein ALC62_14949 [Cyphomyrmex costatus]